MISDHLKEITEKRGKLFDMETKHMTLAELREYKGLTKDCQTIGIKVSLNILLITVIVYVLSLIFCLFVGLNIWYFMGIFMLFIGFSMACVLLSILYDKARRSRELMDDRYIQFEIETNDFKETMRTKNPEEEL